jgi:hypothetical protein
VREGGRNKKQETDEEKTWLVLHKESKQAQKMQHPEKLNQEAKDKTSPGQCDPDNNNDINNNSKIQRRIHNGEEKKAKEEFTKEKEERVCTATAQSQKREKDKASKFTIHEKKNPPHPNKKQKKPKTKRNSEQKKQKKSKETQNKKHA